MENNSQQSAAAAGYPYHHLDQRQQQQLEMFWSFQRQEINQANDFKNRQLPLARIKKIMKANENVQKISAEAPILVAKACDLFIQELTIHSWFHAEENKRCTLQKDDIAAAITQNNFFDFLFDVVHSNEINEQATGLGAGGMVGSAASPSVYVQPTPTPPQGWQSVWQSAEDNASGGTVDRLKIMFTADTMLSGASEAISY